MKPLRVYVDATVFGGCFDPEFEAESRRFFDLVRRRRIVAVVSLLVQDELESAPDAVRQLLEGLPTGQVERTPVSEDVVALREAFIEAKIVTRKSVYDASHVAVAIVAGVDAIVSWNFKHIVRLDKVGQYNGVGMLRGYKPIAIVSPAEVRFDEED